MASRVFVPSTGFFYFYHWKKHRRLQRKSFRPLYGVLLFLPVIDCLMKFYYTFSSPLRGSFISTKYEKTSICLLKMVFVPSTGFFYFYPRKAKHITTKKQRFRPLYGVLLFLLLAISGMKLPCQSFRPLYGVLLFLLKIE